MMSIDRNNKISIHKFRARIIVSLSCITDFALAFFMGCPAALDGATMKKAHANEYVEAMAMVLMSKVLMVGRSFATFWNFWPLRCARRASLRSGTIVGGWGQTRNGAY